MRGVTRRGVLVIAAGAAASLPSARAFAQSTEDTERHGISAFGDLKYPADFHHFGYVDPNAPKGGLFSQLGPGTQFNQNSFTFNSLNSYILRGDAAQGMELTFASLMARSADEPDAMYGLAAKSVRISADGLTYRFTLRSGLTFHDGSKLTAHDVVWNVRPDRSVKR